MLTITLASLTASQAENFTSADLHRRTMERRAVDAVIWGLPLVGEDAVKQAAFRDGKASYNDIVWWPKGGGWKNQSPTPNVNTRYMYFFINTRQDGPVVVELPPAVPGASFYGTIEDAWYVPLTDIGFEGKGGKYRASTFLRRAVRQNGLCRRVEMATAESGRRILLKAITSGSKPACNFESNPNQSRDQLKGRPNKNAKQ